MPASTTASIHFLAMEYVEGKDLASLVKERGRLELAQALDYTLQAARGLAYAHAEAVIHRDIKPGNLLLDKKGTVKVLDMGLARIDPGGPAQGRGTERLTESGAALGTCDYMAPEQAFDTHRADGENGPIAQKWNIKGYPTLYLIDPAGRIRRKGYLRGRVLDAAVDTILKEIEFGLAHDLIAPAAVWAYCDERAGPKPGWHKPGFDESEWKTGRALLGHGKGDEATMLESGPDEESKTPTAYFRHTFELKDPADGPLTLNARGECGRPKNLVTARLLGSLNYDMAISDFFGGEVKQDRESSGGCQKGNVHETLRL